MYTYARTSVLIVENYNLVTHFDFLLMFNVWRGSIMDETDVTSVIQYLSLKDKSRKEVHDEMTAEY